MNGATIEAAIDDIRVIYGRWTRHTTVEQMRADWDAAFAPRAQPWPLEVVDADGIHAEWIAPPGVATERSILYLHGGGFRLGSIESHRDLMQRLAVAASARVLAIDYRLSPEYIYPAALDDAVTAWRWLTRRTDPRFAAIAGDSAGGGLAVSMMLRAISTGVPLPVAAYLLSPWTDLAATGRSYETHASLDPIHQRLMILSMARGYLGSSGDPRDPLASPCYADLTGLPPLLIQCGDREVILDDSRVLERNARTHGVKVTLRVYEGMIHVFQMVSRSPEAHEAITTAGKFLQEQWNIAAGPNQTRHRAATTTTGDP